MKASRQKLLLLQLLVVSALAGAGLSGCGGAGGKSQQGGSEISGTAASAPADVVASVGSSVVTESTLDHWTAIQAIAQHETVPKAAPPAGLVPDPPAFKACMTYLRKGGQVAPKVRSNAQLLRECQAYYHDIRAHALEILVTFKWVEAEARRLGISITDAEVASKFAPVRERLFNSVEEYEVFLRRSDLTLGDEYQRYRINLLSNALQEHFTKEGTPALVRYFREFPRVWAAKTSCRSADINPNCKEYKGTVAPAARL